MSVRPSLSAVSSDTTKGLLRSMSSSPGAMEEESSDKASEAFYRIIREKIPDQCCLKFSLTRNAMSLAMSNAHFSRALVPDFEAMSSEGIFTVIPFKAESESEKDPYFYFNPLAHKYSRVQVSVKYNDAVGDEQEEIILSNSLWRRSSASKFASESGRIQIEVMSLEQDEKDALPLEFIDSIYKIHSIKLKTPLFR